MRTKKIDFYYFSGTGNTLLVVRRMAQTFRQNGYAVRLARIEATDPRTVATDGVLGLAFPVAAQSTYPFILDFFDRLPQADGTEAFMVDTLAAFSGGIVGPLKKLLIKKGYQPIGAREIVMPSNFCVDRIDREKDLRKIERGLATAETFAKDLLAEKAAWPAIPLLPVLFSWIARSGRVWCFMRRRLKNVCAPEKCAADRACRLCAKLCPVGNIALAPTPIFADKCVLCQRCLAFCPTNALSVAGKKYSFYRIAEAAELTAEAPTEIRAPE